MLAYQGGHCASNGFRFVASRNDGNNARPVFKRLWHGGIFAEPPEISAPEEKINPNGKRNSGNVGGREEHTPFCNKRRGQSYARSAARMASRRIALPLPPKTALQTA